MNQIHAILLSTVVATSAALNAQSINFQDDFSGYGTGPSDSINGANWNPKWQSGTDQQNLIMGTGSSAVLDTSVAIRNYHVTSQHGFSLTGTDTAEIKVDFRYTHNALGDTATPNNPFFQLGFSTTPTWYDGDAKNSGLINRGTGIGLSFNTAPWVFGNRSHADNGIADTSVGGTSQWLTYVTDVTVSGGTYWITNSLELTDGTVLLAGTAVDTGTVAGTTIYSQMTTGWINAGADTVETYTNISSVEVDNFSVISVPEPGTYALLAGLLSLSFVAVRRRK